MKRAILICGHICSGKSFVIDQLVKAYQWDVISFGKYIKHLAWVKKLPATRESYQILGQQVFEELGPNKFLANVIQFNKPSSPVHLFDGVRHLPMLEAIRQHYQNTLVIYLNVSDEIRFKRYKIRAAQGDPALTYEEFLKLSEQPVERGISEIKKLADLQIDGTASLQGIIDKIEKI